MWAANSSVSGLSQRKLGNGTWEEVSYDSRSRVTGIALKKPGATLRQHTYGYNAVSNVTSHTVGGITTTYGYDLADQLISESRLGYVASYTYDANGNRATRTVNGVTETHVSDAADKLMSISVGGNTVRSFTYDGRGRRKTDTYAGSTTTYSWDAESRLTSLARPGVTTSSFGYNGLDARVSKTDSTGTFSFKRNGAAVTDPVLSDGAATYTPGISERRGGSSKFLHSGMKNADAQSGASANVDSSRTYDAFGNLTGSVGTWSGPFGYAGGFGYQEDPDHGLRLLGHRYYDSSTGRFISKDPLGDGRNWYGYGAGEGAPTHFVDPDGLRLGRLLKAGKALWDWVKGLGTKKPPVGPAAKPKPATGGNTASKGVSALTGQVHHAISKKVHRALQEHKNLRGLYRERDSRFTSRAQRLEDHNGYDTWHRRYDQEVVDWIRSNPNATKEQFEAFLNRLFSKPDMHRRFPQGLKNESEWKKPK